MSDKDAAGLCEFLDWDSSFFQVRVARLTVPRLTAQALPAIFEWCQTQSIDCLYFLADSDDSRTSRLAEENGFRFVDIRVTLETPLRNAPSGKARATLGRIRLATPQDIPALRAVARVSHRDSRFYYDGNFSAPGCDALYETWIEKSCTGYAEAVLVAELEGEPVGYVSCHLPAPGKGQIGLIGVAEAAQGKALGQELVNESLRWFFEHGAREVTVVTQGRNCRAQRLYQRCGFLTRSVQLWYHRWFPRIGA